MNFVLVKCGFILEKIGMSLKARINFKRYISDDKEYAEQYEHIPEEVEKYKAQFKDELDMNPRMFGSYEFESCLIDQTDNTERYTLNFHWVPNCKDSLNKVRKDSNKLIILEEDSDDPLLRFILVLQNTYDRYGMDGFYEIESASWNDVDYSKEKIAKFHQIERDRQETEDDSERKVGEWS